MNKIYYYILIIFSKIPLIILYLLADLIFIINYYSIGYRKKTIYNNLKNSFPNKSEKEIKIIIKKFYKNFADYIVETIKLFTIQKEALAKIHTHSNEEVILESKKNNKNIILLAGHFFNWEYYIQLGNILPFEHKYAVYKRINSVFWNEKINFLRSRFGTEAIEMGQTMKHFMATNNDGNSGYLFISDQSPFKKDIHYDLMFLNQLTPVFIGYDLLARRKNYDIIYLNTIKLKRGRYHTEFIKINPDEINFKPNEIVHKFYDLLEKNINQQPDLWLWSHKRWKYKKGIHY